MSLVQQNEINACLLISMHPVNKVHPLQHPREAAVAPMGLVLVVEVATVPAARKAVTVARRSIIGFTRLDLVAQFLFTLQQVGLLQKPNRQLVQTRRLLRRRLLPTVTGIWLLAKIVAQQLLPCGDAMSMVIPSATLVVSSLILIVSLCTNKPQDSITSSTAVIAPPT